MGYFTEKQAYLKKKKTKILQNDYAVPTVKTYFKVRMVLKGNQKAV